MSIASRRNTSRANKADSQRPGSGHRDLEKGAGDGGDDDKEGGAAGVDFDDTNTDHDTDDDANVVWWDGPNDAENPMNWSTRKKFINIGLVSGMTLVSPLASCKFSLLALPLSYSKLPGRPVR